MYLYEFFMKLEMMLFFDEKDNSIILRVRLTPNSSSCAVRGVFVDADGQAYLRVNVVAVPEKGKANQELIKYLSRLLRVSKSEIEFVSGETDRYKKLRLPFVVEIREKLQSLLEESVE